MNELFQFKEDHLDDAVPLEIDPFRTAMAEALNCAVCNEVFTDPHLLACGHCFCGPCLFNWFRTKKSCPKCRFAVVKKPTKAFCIQHAANVLCEHSPHISRSGNTERIEHEQWRAFFAIENELGYIVDNEDAVRRCISCAWEIGTDNSCPNCGAQYNSDPDQRDDTADEDSEGIDYAREFGVNIAQQRHIYNQIRNNNRNNQNTNGNNSLFHMEASDEDNISEDDDSVNENYRDEEDLDDFVVSDNHYESSSSHVDLVDSSDDDSSEEEQSHSRSLSLVPITDSTDDENQLKRRRLKRNNGESISIYDDDDIETIESDDGAKTVDSDDDSSAAETQPPRVTSKGKRKQHIEFLVTSSEDDSEDDNAGEGPSTQSNGSSSNGISKIDKGKIKILLHEFSTESENDGSSNEESEASDSDEEENSNNKKDTKSMKKGKGKAKETFPNNEAESSKSKKKKSSKKRKAKAKAKAKKSKKQKSK